MRARRNRPRAPRGWDLWEEFARQQVPVDFVGPRSTTRGVGYNPGASFDTDHAALGGTTVAVERKRIRRQVAAYRPDVLIAPLGHNNLARGGTPAQVAADMRAYVRAARRGRAGVRIVLGTVMGASRDGRSKFAGRNLVLNRHYRTIAAELGTRRSPIVVAEMDHPGWRPAQDTFDVVHLTPSGEEKVMARIARALHDPRIGALPPTRHEPPSQASAAPHQRHLGRRPPAQPRLPDLAPEVAHPPAPGAGDAPAGCRHLPRPPATGPGRDDRPAGPSTSFTVG